MSFEVRAADRHVRGDEHVRDVTSGPKQEHAVGQAQLLDERLEAPALGPVAGDEDAKFRLAIAHQGGRLDEHLHRLLGPKLAHGDDDGALRDPELRPDVVAVGTGAATAFGMTRSCRGRIPSTSIIRRLSASDTAMKTSAPRAITSRSIVLRTNGPAVEERAEAQLCSCDDDGDTREAPEQRAPDVRAELVRMEDVDLSRRYVNSGRQAAKSVRERRSSRMIVTPAARRSSSNVGLPTERVAQRTLSKRAGSSRMATETAIRSPPPLMSGWSRRVTTRSRSGRLRLLTEVLCLTGNGG